MIGAHSFRDPNHQQPVQRFVDAMTNSGCHFTTGSPAVGRPSMVPSHSCGQRQSTTSSTQAFPAPYISVAVVSDPPLVAFNRAPKRAPSFRKSPMHSGPRH